MEYIIEKVTAFITRNKNQRTELLLFQHPTAGIQIPSGTVENEETVEKALIREVAEETGLKNTSIKQYIGYMEKTLPADQFILLKKSKVYSQPVSTSFGWAELRKGIPLIALRTNNAYTQVTYLEYDNLLNPEYISYQITGWVPSHLLCNKTKRHFFHLTINEAVKDEWEIFADNHAFKLFWSPLTRLPQIIAPQSQWLEFIRHNLGYNL
ncbi:MAG: NUDIX domain-containing protein [Candidatus Hodarchaeales archaeon]